MGQTITSNNPNNKFIEKPRINPKLLSEVKINGNFIYNSTIIFIPGVIFIINENPLIKTILSAQYKGYYVVPDQIHYWFLTIYVTKTVIGLVVDTVEFTP